MSDTAVVEVRGWRLGLAICRDTGIAEHANATAALGIDAYVAGVVDLPEEAPTQLERAKRIATGHHVWVATASGAGPAASGFELTAGRSFIVSPGGDVVDRAGPAMGEIARATMRCNSPAMRASSRPACGGFKSCVQPCDGQRVGDCA